MTEPLRYRSDYGVTLSRVTEADIELVRTWRNDPDITQFMEFRDHITEDMQRAWFQRINNELNYIFLVEHEGRKVGVAENKNISRERRCAEGGQFYTKEVWNSLVPLQGSFTSFDFTFKVLGLDYVESRVLRTNVRAIRFNLAVGYVLQPGQENVENQLYRVTHEDYERKTARLRKTLARAVK